MSVSVQRQFFLFNFPSPNANVQALDMMHLGMHGYGAYIDDRKVKLADILHTVGATMQWTYDLGDLWLHEIKLVEIIDAENSTGKCVVLDGCGMAPPEDSNGLEGKSSFWKRELITCYDLQ